MPICVHCEDEATIRKNTEIYKEQFGEDIPVKFHHLIRSEEVCYLSSSKAIELAKKTGARLHVYHLSTAKEMELFRNDIPPVVSINEAVEIAKAYISKESGRFVNGVLDRIQNELARPSRTHNPQ